MSKVIVIGAGASGIIAAIKASYKNDVILIDGNDKCGKKLLVTGNGKCNYWNEDINVLNYFNSHNNKLENILEYKEEVLNYLYSIGIYPKIKNGYYYPMSGMASSVRETFDKEIKRNNIITKYNSKVIDIEKENNEYKVILENEVIYTDKLIIATGSKAFPKTGSDGFGYLIAKKFNHKINSVLPSLVALKTNDKLIKEATGVRSEVILSLYCDNSLVKEENGEIQITDDGISGICTFNLSGLVSKALNNKKEVFVKINFVPEINDFYNFFENRNREIANRTIEELLESIMNYKLINIILKRCVINKDKHWNDLSIIEQEMLIKNIVEFELKIVGTNSYDKAQVCTGGIPLNEINDNMESIYNDNLYFVGELLDVDGKCGGFNLAFAFITGYIAGSSV